MSKQYPDYWIIEGRMIHSPFAFTSKYDWFEHAWKNIPENIREKMRTYPRTINNIRWKFIDNWTPALIQYLQQNSQENK